MDVDVDGNNNRVAGRDYYHVEHMQGRLLTKDERSKLHAKATALEEEFGEPSWKTWKAIHSAVGVESINELRIEHYNQVVFILGLFEEQYRLNRQIQEAGLPDPQDADKPDTLDQKISKGGIITWVTEFPEYAGFLFFMGIMTGATLITI